MGQKVHPYGFRLGYIKDWHSSWYAKDNFGETLQEDLKIRAYVDKNLSNASIAKTEITRTSEQVKVTVYSAKPGVAIGKKGAGIEVLDKALEAIQY